MEDGDYGGSRKERKGRDMQRVWDKGGSKRGTCADLVEEFVAVGMDRAGIPPVSSCAASILDDTGCLAQDTRYYDRHEVLHGGFLHSQKP